MTFLSASMLKVFTILMRALTLAHSQHDKSAVLYNKYITLILYKLSSFGLLSVKKEKLVQKLSIVML